MRVRECEVREKASNLPFLGYSFPGESKNETERERKNAEATTNSNSNHCNINDSSNGERSGRHNRPCSRHYSNRNPESKDRRAKFFRTPPSEQNNVTSVASNPLDLAICCCCASACVCKCVRTASLYLRPCDLADFSPFPFFLPLVVMVKRSA